MTNVTKKSHNRSYSQSLIRAEILMSSETNTGEPPVSNVKPLWLFTGGGHLQQLRPYWVKMLSH